MIGEEDSSIDGELQGFLNKYDIPTTKKATSGDSAEDEMVGGIGDGAERSNINDADISDILLDDPSGFQDPVNVLMPACIKMNKLMTNHGFKVTPILPEHIDMESRFVNSIADHIYQCMATWVAPLLHLHLHLHLQSRVDLCGGQLGRVALHRHF